MSMIFWLVKTQRSRYQSSQIKTPQQKQLNQKSQEKYQNKVEEACVLAGDKLKNASAKAMSQGASPSSNGFSRLIATKNQWRRAIKIICSFGERSNAGTFFV